MYLSSILLSYQTLLQNNVTLSTPELSFTAKYAIAYSWGIMSVNAVIALPLGVITFIAIIILTIRKKQPISSRHIAPWFGQTYIILNAIFSIIFTILLQTQVIMQDQLLYYWFFLVALQQAAIMSYVIQTIRYFIMRGMYNNISNVIEFRNLLYRRITSKKLFVIIVLSYAVFCWCYSTAWTFVSIYQVISPYYVIFYVRDYVFFGLSVIMLIAILITFAYDALWTNRRVLFVRCQWKDYFTNHDPLRFRIEILFIAIGLFCIYFSSIFNYFTIPTTNPYGLAVGAAIFYAIGVIFYILGFGGMAVINTILFMIRDAKKHKVLSIGNLESLTGEQKLYKVLLDQPDGFHLIAMYCAHELSSENLNAWVDLNKIIPKWSNLDAKDRTANLHMIYRKYIQPDAAQEINLPNNVRNMFLLLIGKGSFIIRDNKDMRDMNEAEFQLNVLMDLNKSVVENLADTFARLEETTNFKIYWQILLEKEKIEMKGSLFAV
jgi:hypothetical protein